jgi:hypothetical protein
MTLDNKWRRQLRNLSIVTVVLLTGRKAPLSVAGLSFNSQGTLKKCIQHDGAMQLGEISKNIKEAQVFVCLLDF